MVTTKNDSRIKSRNIDSSTSKISGDFEIVAEITFNKSLTTAEHAIAVGEKQISQSLPKGYYVQQSPNAEILRIENANTCVMQVGMGLHYNAVNHDNEM